MAAKADGRASALSWAVSDGEGTTRCPTRAADMHSPDEHPMPPPADLPGGQDLMQGFIRHFMLSILNPVAEHVRDLESQVEELRNGFREQDERHDDTQLTLDSYSQDVKDVRLGLVRNSARLDRAEEEVKIGREERSEFTLERESLRKDISELRMKTTTLETTIKNVKEKAIAAENDQRSIKLQADICKSIVDESQASLKALRADMQNMHERLIDTAKDVVQARQESESNHRYIKILEQTFEHYREDDKKNQGRGEDAAHRMEKDIADLRRNVDKEAEDTRAALSDISALREALELASGTSNKLESLRSKQGEVEEALEEQVRRMEVVSEGLERLSGAHVMDKHRNDVQMAEFQRQMLTNKSDISDLLTGQQQHSDHLKQTAKTLAEQQASQKRMSEHATHLEKEVQCLVTWQKAAASEIEMHSMENFKVFADLQNMSEVLEATNTDVRGLRDELGMTNATVSQLSIRFSACKQNIQGLSKGFQQTYQHVISGEAGMLQPKSSQSTGLPSLGTSGGPMMRSPVASRPSMLAGSPPPSSLSPGPTLQGHRLSVAA